MVLEILYVVSVLDALSLSMTLVVLNPYILSLGGTQFYLGTMGSGCAFITLIWNPIVGGLSDRIGRKPVLLLCLSICFIANLLMVLSSSLVVIFFSRMLAALGTQIAALTKSLIDDNIKEKKDLSNVLNRVQALGGVCLMLGALIGGHLSEYDNGISRVFFLVSAVFAINFGLVLLIKSENKQNKPSKQTAPSIGVLDGFTSSIKNLTNIDLTKYWDVLIIKMLNDISFCTLQFTSSITFITRFGITGKMFGYIFTFNCLIGIVTNIIMMRLKEIIYSKDKQGSFRLLFGSTLLAIAYLGFGLSSTFSIYLIFNLPFAIGKVLTETTVTEVVLLRATPTEKGSVMGTFESTMALGGLIAPILAGITSEMWSAATAVMLCSFVPSLISTTIAYSNKY